MFNRSIKTVLFVIFPILFLSFVQYANAQTVPSVAPKPIFMKAQVDGIVSEKANPYSNYKSTIQVFNVTILDGPNAGKSVQVNYDSQNIPNLMLSSGDTVILSETTNAAGQAQFSVEDTYRLTPVIIITVAFIILVFLIAGLKGLGSFAGLAISILIIFSYIVPQILSGADPLTVCMIGAVGILLVTTYTAHGFSKQTTIALASTFVALIATYIFSILFVKLSLLTGYVDENSISLHFGTGHTIDIKGLLLGGIVIGTLGALNDITITQTATVFELSKTDSSLSTKLLFKKGMRVAREHVVSLINTLVLAYAGSSLSVFIILFFNSGYYPLWVILNSETLSEEIIRTIAGTTGLLLVVPVVTIIASHFASQKVKSV